MTTARRLGRPPAVDSTVTRGRILTAARRSFASRGYDATTNRDIATDAGVTTGALYHYTASKADLYGQVYGQVQDLVYGEFEKAFVHDDFIDRFRRRAGGGRRAEPSRPVPGRVRDRRLARGGAAPGAP